MPCVSTPQAAACDCARPFVSLDAPRFSLVRVPPLGSTPLAAPPWQHPSPAPERYRALPCLLRARWAALAGSALPRRGLEEAGPLSAPPLHFSLHDGLAAYDPSGGARTTGCSRGQTGSSPCATLTRCASTRLPTACSAEHFMTVRKAVNCNTMHRLASGVSPLLSAKNYNPEKPPRALSLRGLMPYPHGRKPSRGARSAAAVD